MGHVDNEMGNYSCAPQSSPNLRLPSVTQNKGALFAIFDQSIVVLDYIAVNICGIKQQQLYWQSKWALLSTKVHCICQVCKNIGSSGSDALDTTCKKPHPINSADVIKQGFFSQLFAKTQGDLNSRFFSKFKNFSLKLKQISHTN